MLPRRPCVRSEDIDNMLYQCNLIYIFQKCQLFELFTYFLKNNKMAVLPHFRKIFLKMLFFALGPKTKIEKKLDSFLHVWI